MYSIDSGQLIFTIRKIEEEFLKEYNYKIFEIFTPLNWKPVHVSQDSLSFVFFFRSSKTGRGIVKRTRLIINIQYEDDIGREFDIVQIEKSR